MNSKIFSKFITTRIHCHNQKICFMTFSIHHKSSQKVKPINMAFTTYETINEESENEIPILILHGVLGSKSNWNTMGRQIALRALRKVVTLDLRNHGDSPHTKEFGYEHIMADIKQLMAEMDFKEVILVGHSIGGRAALAFALTYPDMVNRAVAVDISPVSISRSVRQFPAVLTAMKSIKLSSYSQGLIVARAEADKQLAKSISNKHVRDFLLMNLAYDEKRNRFFWKVNIQALIDKLHTFSEFPFDGVFNKPTLFIAGAKSDYMRRGDEPLILKKFPQAQFKYVENSGHIVHIEKPDAFLNILSSFLNEEQLSSMN